MKLNCQAGDLAMVVLGKYAGRLVDVLYLAPMGEHKPPNGSQAYTTRSDCWVVKCRDRFFRIGTVSRADLNTVSGSRLTKFVCAADYGLRPIRDPGDDAVDEMVLRKPVPTPETV